MIHVGSWGTHRSLLREGKVPGGLLEVTGQGLGSRVRQYERRVPRPQPGPPGGWGPGTEAHSGDAGGVCTRASRGCTRTPHRQTLAWIWKAPDGGGGLSRDREDQRRTSLRACSLGALGGACDRAGAGRFGVQIRSSQAGAAVWSGASRAVRGQVGGEEAPKSSWGPWQ